MPMVVPGHPRRLITLAAFVVVSFGIAAGQFVMVPVLLTLVIVIVSAPLYQTLQRRGLPAWLARLVVMACVLVALGTLFLILAAVLRGLFARMPLYEAQYATFRAGLNAYFRDNAAIGQELTGLLPAPTQVADVLRRGLRTLLTHVWPAWLLVFLVQDALEEADTMPQAVLRLFPSGPRLWKNWQLSAGFVRQYMGMRTLEGVLKGVVVFGLAWLLGIDFPLAWAMIAFLTTFLPQAIGQPLALLGPALMAMIGPGAWAAAIYVVVYPLLDWGCDMIFEPYLDASVRISGFQAGVAVIYWALVLGPLGAFLAVPLTVMLRAALASFEESWPIAVLMYQDAPEPQSSPHPAEGGA